VNNERALPPEGEMPFSLESARWEPQVIWDPEWGDLIYWEGRDSPLWHHSNMYGQAGLIDDDRIVHGAIRSATGRSYLFTWDVERASGTLRPDPSPVPADKDAEAFSVRNHEDGSVSVIEHGRITVLPSLGGRKSVAHMHNAKGDIVGYSETPDDEQKAVLWRGASMTVLANPFVHSEADEVSSGGTIIGSGWDTRDDCLQGLIWEGDGPAQVIRGTLNAVDETGLVAGFEPAGDCWSHDYRIRAFLWRRGEFAYLPAPEPYLWSNALGIGKTGDIVGEVHVQRQHEETLLPLPGQVPCVWLLTPGGPG
jgi:probable HAF family extracellular repeat protein